MNSLTSNNIIKSFFYVSILLIATFVYWQIASTTRVHFNELWTAYLIVFALYIFILLKFSIRWLIVGFILFRLAFIFELPHLSDDYYRFLWDGWVIKEGYSPYAYTPNELLQIIKNSVNSNINAFHVYINEGTLAKLNSKEYYSVYPPTSQLFFLLGTLATSELASVNFIRGGIFIFELGFLYLWFNRYKGLKDKQHKVFWYLLNPLVIIENTGNLHLEGIMLILFWIACSIPNTHKGIWKIVLWNLSILTKLFSLAWLPFFLKSTSLKTQIKYLISTLLLVGIGFIAFTPNWDWLNIGHSLRLYYQVFEFNASLYYVLRWIGYQIWGYNQIYYLGPLLVLVSVVYWIIIYWQVAKKLNFFEAACLFTLIYYLCSTTVHPWYIVTLVFLGLHTKYSYPIVWSFTVFLSYHAYQTPIVTENYWLSGIQYNLLLIALAFDMYRQQRNKTGTSKLSLI